MTNHELAEEIECAMRERRNYLISVETDDAPKIVAALRREPERQPSGEMMGFLRFHINPAVPENEVWVSDGKQLVKITNLLSAAEAEKDKP